MASMRASDWRTSVSDDAFAAGSVGAKIEFFGTFSSDTELDGAAEHAANKKVAEAIHKLRFTT